jgi:predicted glycoside hydrolase/deacetylase ChbG (UPF0249 family)
MNARGRLIINADDLGLSPQINTGIFKGIEAGVVTDVSLMAKAPYAADAAESLRGHGITCAGIHVNLDDLLGWRSPGIEHHTREQLQQRFAEASFRARLEAEAREQIEIFLSLGLKPSHIDSHHHVHGFPAVFAIMLTLMGDYGIRAMRYSAGGYGLPTRADIPWSSGLAARVQTMLQEKAILTCDCMLEGAGRLMEASSGITELVVHPAMGGDPWRDEELKVLLCVGTPSISERFELISFQDFQEALRD